VADIDNDGLAEVIAGTLAQEAPWANTHLGGYLHVIKGDGYEPWPFPIYTQEFIESSPAVGDLNGAALAEMRWGSGRGFQDFAYVTVGTGVGVGLIANGLPMRGFAHCELGHIRVARLAGDDFPGSCPFHEDCVEGLAAGPSLMARVGTERVKDLSSDDPVWNSVAWALAQLCHAIVCAAAPRAIVFGGGVIDNQPHLLERIETMLVDSLNGYMTLPKGAPYVRSPELGRDAGPLGAIALAMTARR
jgi:fructokinase